MNKPESFLWRNDIDFGGRCDRSKDSKSGFDFQDQSMR
jgi:hypothetical protein